MKENSNTNAIFQSKCPRCRKGSMFQHSAFNILGFSKMNEKCPECGLKFEVEPGFFFGAMYISYAFNVALMVAVGVALSVLFDPELWVYVVSVISASVLFLPFSFRFSRVLFLHFFGGIDFDPQHVN